MFIGTTCSSNEKEYHYLAVIKTESESSIVYPPTLNQNIFSSTLQVKYYLDVYLIWFDLI